MNQPVRWLCTTGFLVLLLCARCSEGDGDISVSAENEEPTPAMDRGDESLLPTEEATQGGGDMTMQLTSEAFSHGEPIPRLYSCDGDDTSPPLRWTDPPEGTQSFALIMDDPDAPMGTWVHWVIFNLPANTRMLAAGFPLDPQISNGARNGRNSWGRMGYGGPCPPDGTHRYFFRLYALDQILTLAPGANKAQVLQIIQGHILAEAELMGTYQR